jgi:hypothetical protein
MVWDEDTNIDIVHKWLNLGHNTSMERTFILIILMVLVLQIAL